MCVCVRVCNLRFAVLLDPAEDARRELLEAADRHRGDERLEERVHDVLKDAELHLIGHLLASLLRVVLVSLHDLFVVSAPHTHNVMNTQDDE